MTRGDRRVIFGSGGCDGGGRGGEGGEGERGDGEGRGRGEGEGEEGEDYLSKIMQKCGAVSVPIVTGCVCVYS
jgi:hypothetical protein